MFAEADDLEFDDPRASPPGKVPPLPFRAVPDWLTGPADGLDAASDPHDDTTDEAPPETLPQPVLRRPRAPAPTLALVTSDEPDDEAPPETPPQPVLRRPGVPAPVLALVTSDEPEAARVEAEEAVEGEVVAGPARPRRVAPPGVWAPVASSVPVLKSAVPAEPEPVEDEIFVVPAARPRGLPGGDEDLTRVVAAPPPLAALREPWWIIALDALRTSRSVQITVAVALVALVLTGSWLWPRGAGTTSLSELRRNPSHFDGRTVTVRGRVGDDVFTVGAGWAFYLVQGRDTIVTFTRTQMPKPHDVITVKGQVSTGFLDGVPRQALFEDVTPTQ